MGGSARVHDRAILDVLERIEPFVFSGTAWRVTRKGRDALRGSTAFGRWSPGGDIEIVNTSLDRTGALAEVGYRLSLEPIWPSHMEHEVHQLDVRTSRSLKIDDLQMLAQLGVEVARYRSFDYTATGAIAAAAYFLEFDSMIVPSTRASCENLILFSERIGNGIDVTLRGSAPVDWTSWKKPGL